MGSALPERPEGADVPRGNGHRDRCRVSGAQRHPPQCRLPILETVNRSFYRNGVFVSLISSRVSEGGLAGVIRWALSRHRVLAGGQRPQRKGRAQRQSSGC